MNMLGWVSLALADSSSAPLVGIMPFGCCCIFYVLLILFALVAKAFWIWMIIDVATNEPGEDQNKIVWLLVVIFTSFIGAAIYYFVRRPERQRKYGR